MEIYLIFQITVHNDKGLYFKDGAPDFGDNSCSFNGVDGKVKSFTSSQCGTKFAWIINGE